MCARVREEVKKKKQRGKEQSAERAAGTVPL